MYSKTVEAGRLRIDVRRADKPSSSDWRKGYFYTVYDECGYRGDAELLLGAFNNLAALEPLPQSLAKAGINPERDTVSLIKSFYPNGSAIRSEAEKKMRQGVGSAVLNTIVHDAASEGAKAVCASTRGREMKSFLGKNGFILCNPEELWAGTTYHYLPL